jgi:hypothetical protein
MRENAVRDLLVDLVGDISPLEGCGCTSGQTGGGCGSCTCTGTTGCGCTGSCTGSRGVPEKSASLDLEDLVADLHDLIAANRRTNGMTIG